MPHAKQQIRDGVVSLVTGLTTTGSNVFSARVYNHETLPSLNVMAADESAAPLYQDGTQLRTLTIVIEARAKAAADVDDQVDDIQSEVETAIHADHTLGGLVIHAELRDVEDDLSDEGNRPATLRTMTFEARYLIDPTAPNTLIN